MPDIAQELAALGMLYNELEQALGAVRQSIGNIGSNKTCFQNLTSLVERSSAAGSSLADLTRSWKEERRKLPPEKEKHLAIRAQDLQERAVHLQRQILQLDEELRKVRDAAQASLSELHNGSRFLKSVIPESSREPRFLDTRE